MARPVRTVVRFGVIGLLVGGSTAIIAEQVRPGSVNAMLNQAASLIGDQIDARIDDPAALRAQLAELKSQYPEKIAEVRSDLGDVTDQLASLERELAVSERVVDLAAADLARLGQQIASARDTQEAARADADHVVVRIAFQDQRLRIDQALSRRTQIERTMQVHETRARELDTEVDLLAEQKAQLADLLSRLETEHAEFESQIVQLDAQIEAIERGERMLATMEDRQRTIDEHSRYRAASLGQLQARLDRAREEQRARMTALAEDKSSTDYEDLARFEISRSDGAPRVIIEDATGTDRDREILIRPEPLNGDPNAEGPTDEVASR